MRNLASPRALQLGGVVLAAVVLFLLVLSLFFRGSTSPVPRLTNLDEGVSLGLVDQLVLDELRESGESTAILHLNTDAAIAALKAEFPEADIPQLIDRASQLWAANKEAILRGLGRDAELVRDFEVLGAAIVTFRSEDALLAVLQSALVRGVTANVPVDLPPDAEEVDGELVPRAPTAYDGSGAVVGVLDSGVDAAAYSDFFPDGSIVELREMRDDDGDGVPNDDGQPDDRRHHGSHVSSIVLMEAPEARLYVADVFSERPWRDEPRHWGAWETELVAGVAWMVELKRDGIDVRAVNLSLGSGYYPANSLGCTDRYNFWELVDWDIIPVVAAGNDAFSDDEGNASDTYRPGLASPACVAGAMSVGNHTGHPCWGQPAGEVLRGSQSSEQLTLYAPGACIVAAGGEKTGTSMAAPRVAGAIAVLWSAGAESDEAVRDALANSGELLRDPDSGVERPMLDVQAALQRLGNPGGSVDPLPDPRPGLVVLSDVSTGMRAFTTGEAGSLGSILVSNVDTRGGTYGLEAVESDLQLAAEAPGSWFAYEPASVSLEPFDSTFVSVTVTVPSDAAPGHYATLIAPRGADGSATGSGIYVTFDVVEGGLPGGLVAAVLLALAVIGGLWALDRYRKRDGATPGGP